jgi:hypothetical protein
MRSGLLSMSLCGLLLVACSESTPSGPRLDASLPDDAGSDRGIDGHSSDLALPSCGEPAAAGAVDLTGLSAPATAQVNAVWELAFALKVKLDGQDRFDPSKADLWATIVRPDGKQERVPAFYKQDQSPRWALRYAPRVEGPHKLALSGQVLGQSAELSEICFVAAAASNTRPFVQLDPKHPARLSTSDGRAFVAVGLNAPACPTQGDGSYAKAFKALAAFNFNMARVWAQARWGGHAFERKNPPGKSEQWQCGDKTVFSGALGDYSTDALVRVDAIMENAQREGIYLLWTIALHEDWKFPLDYETNPYASLLPASCGPQNGSKSDCSGYWSDPTGLTMLERNLRYTYARWGAYSSLAIVELYNEADQAFLLDAQQGGFASWHERLARYWRDDLGDIYDHPLTSSFSWTDHFTGNNKPPAKSWGESYETWNKLPSLDISQQHYYSADADAVERWVEETLTNQPLGAGARGKRPFFFGEVGLPAPHWDASDPDGQFYTDVAWVPFFFAEALGTGFRWWIEKLPGHADVQVLPTEQLDRGYRCFGAFVAGELDHLRDQQHVKRSAVQGSVEVAGYRSDRRALLMVRDGAATWNQAQPSEQSGLKLALEGFVDGSYVAEFWPLAAASCQPLSTLKVEVSGGKAAVSLPAFRRGLGLRLRPGS